MKVYNNEDGQRTLKKENDWKREEERNAMGLIK
jgi:hypothetical protein